MSYRGVLASALVLTLALAGCAAEQGPVREIIYNASKAPAPAAIGSIVTHCFDIRGDLEEGEGFWAAFKADEVETYDLVPTSGPTEEVCVDRSSESSTFRISLDGGNPNSNRNWFENWFESPGWITYTYAAPEEPAPPVVGTFSLKLTPPEPAPLGEPVEACITPQRPTGATNELTWESRWLDLRYHFFKTPGWGETACVTIENPVHNAEYLFVSWYKGTSGATPAMIARFNYEAILPAKEAPAAQLTLGAAPAIVRAGETVTLCATPALLQGNATATKLTLDITSPAPAANVTYDADLAWSTAACVDVQRETDFSYRFTLSLEDMDGVALAPATTNGSYAYLDERVSILAPVPARLADGEDGVACATPILQDNASDVTIIEFYLETTTYGGWAHARWGDEFCVTFSPSALDALGMRENPYFFTVVYQADGRQHRLHSEMRSFTFAPSMKGADLTGIRPLDLLDAYPYGEPHNICWALEGTGAVPTTLLALADSAEQFTDPTLPRPTPHLPTGDGVIAPYATNATYCTTLTFNRTGTFYGVLGAITENGASNITGDMLTFNATLGAIESIKVTSRPEKSVIGSAANVCWRVEGSGRVEHVALHYDTRDHASEGISAYPHVLFPDNATSAAKGGYALPGAFCASLPTTSSIWFRAHTLDRSGPPGTMTAEEYLYVYKDTSTPAPPPPPPPSSGGGNTGGGGGGGGGVSDFCKQYPEDCA